MDSIKAVVEKVVVRGPHGPYAIATEAYQSLAGSVTFSLEPTVWEEKTYPEPGEVVCLYELREKRQGWRAKKGRFWKPSDEQTAKENLMMKELKIMMQKAWSKLMPSEDDEAWKAWVDFRKREMRDLVALLETDVRMTLKRRAVFLLLVPCEELNPFYWKDKIGKFYHGTEFIEGLEEELSAFASGLITQYIKSMRLQHTGLPGKAVAGGGGVIVYTDVPEKFDRPLRFYNGCILRILACASENICETIMPYFSLNDVSAYCNLDDFSGYNPFQQLMDDGKIGERWKRMADEKMRKIVLDEIDGKTSPREPWENAFNRYADIVQPFGELRYPAELFAEQMRFIVDHHPKGENPIDPWKITRIFNLLSGDEHRELRHDMARMIVMEKRRDSAFSVYCSESLEAAEMMLKEFGKEDEDLGYILESLIREYQTEKRDKVLQKRREGQNEEDILSKMR